MPAVTKQIIFVVFKLMKASKLCRTAGMVQQNDWTFGYNKVDFVLRK
jgi:hypothetical protein